MGEIVVGADQVPIKLARVPAFRLGEVEVDPPSRRISRGDKVEILEPRVMQVLVVLAEAEGAVISRDELIERCWGGRIVGENAINRVISRIRQAATDVGMDSFQLETITKVGYRMVAIGQAAPVVVAAREASPPPWPESNRDRPAAVAEPPEADEPLAPPTFSRRSVAAGGVAALGVGALGTWLWTTKQAHRPHPEALELYRRGQIAQREGVAEQTRQAVSFLEQATQIDPLFADAWGALALAYRHILEGFAGDRQGLPQLIESAALRALELDPNNGDAQIALVIIRPNFRNWRRIEADLMRVAERHPDHWFVQAQLGVVRYDVGRWRDGLRHTERQLEIEPYIPIAHFNRARALWAVGRLQEAERVLDAAIERWNGRAEFWILKYNLLLFSGRTGAAAAFALNPEKVPERLRANGVEARVTLARAVEQRRPQDIAAVLADLRAVDSVNPQSAHYSAPILALFGMGDAAIHELERFYFGGPARTGSPAAAPPGAMTRRPTLPLFLPNMAPLWREPRFAALLDRIGLERYWRETGTLPDFRRAS